MTTITTEPASPPSIRLFGARKMPRKLASEAVDLRAANAQLREHALLPVAGPRTPAHELQLTADFLQKQAEDKEAERVECERLREERKLQ